MTFLVYILQSEVDRSLYIGQTQNLNERLTKHNKGYIKSTKHKKPWLVIFSKPYETRSEACKVERYLKGLKKRQSVFNWIAKNHGV